MFPWRSAVVKQQSTLSVDVPSIPAAHNAVMGASVEEGACGGRILVSQTHDEWIFVLGVNFTTWFRPRSMAVCAASQTRGTARARPQTIRAAANLPANGHSSSGAAASVSDFSIWKRVFWGAVCGHSDSSLLILQLSMAVRASTQSEYAHSA